MHICYYVHTQTANHVSAIMLTHQQQIVVPACLSAVDRYYRQSNLTFKTLLLLDKALGCPNSLGDLCENVKICYLSQRTTSLIQPMDHRVIFTFKAHYLTQTLE